jgi:putative hydrolase of HD superfamily
MTHPDPAAVVQAQLDAYNAKDLDALMRTYAPDAQQFTLHGPLLAEGIDQIRPRYAARFLEPDLHARLLSRTVLGKVVTDLEVVTRNFPEGKGCVEMLCIYEVVDGRIARASFATGATTLLAAAR